MTVCLVRQALFDTDIQSSSEHLLPSDGTLAHGSVIPGHCPNLLTFKGKRKETNTC